MNAATKNEETFAPGTEPHNPTTGNTYSGGNVRALFAEAAKRGYKALAFAGFSQWANAGRMVSKDEKAIWLTSVYEWTDKATGAKKRRPSKVKVFAIEQTHVMSDEEKAAWAKKKASRNSETLKFVNT